MYFSKESRYRNLGRPQTFRRREGVPPLLIVGIAAFLMICCSCAGLIVGLQMRGVNLAKALPGSNPVASTPKATPTANMKAEVPLKTKGLQENGLELTVTALQRPLQVQNLTKVAADQQFVLVSVTVHNSKSSGQPLALNAADFKVKGDGGLTYDANPKIVTIDNLMASQDTVAPGKDLDRELIFQIAKDDSGLKLYWTVGKTTRVFILEPDK